VEELLAPTLLPLSVASTLREVADSPDTSSTLPSLTPFIILAKANVVMKLSCSSCCLRVCLRGELIQGSKGCCGYLWHEIPTSTVSACSHATANQRRGRAVLGGGRALPGVGCPLTGSGRHRLRMVGSWLDLERVPMGPLVQSCQVHVLFSFLLFGLNHVSVALWALFDIFSCWLPANKYFTKTLWK
jgi:hypothetical protein